MPRLGDDVYILSLILFMAFLVVGYVFRNRMLEYIYDPFFQVSILSFFSAFFVVPFLMLTKTSRYQVFEYSLDAQMKYLIFTSIFSFVFSLLAIFAAKSKWLINRGDVVFIVARMQPSEKNIHWLLLLVLAFPLMYPIYEIGSKILAMGYGIYLANRIIVASGSGYLFVALIFPVFISLMLAVNYVVRRGLSFRTIVLCIIGLIFSSMPLLLTGSRSSLVIGVLIFVLVLFILSASRGIARLKKMAIALILMGLGLLAALTSLGVVRQSIMGATDLNEITMHVDDRSSSSLEVFGTNENLLWMFDNPDRVRYLFGASYASVLVGPYPRSLWANKPTGAGPVLKNWIAPGSYDLGAGENISSYTTGFMSELFMNFGWFGVVIGPAILAMICLFFSHLIRKIRSEIGLVCWAVVSLRFLGFVNAEFYGVCIHIFVAVVFFALYAWFYQLISARRVR